MPSAQALNDYMKLESAGHVDCATLLPIEVSNLPRGLHARCIAFHPLRPILAVGIQSCVGAYDLMTGVRLGRVDIRTPPVAMLFSRDGSLLVVATQEWHIIGINTSNWRSRVLAPFTEARNTPLDNIMMAITGGSRPVVFFTRYGKNSIRMAVNAGDGSAKKASADRKLKWGVKLKLDVNKAVVGLAAHPSTTALLVIFDDGTLRGYGMSPNGLQPLWPSVFALPGDTAALLRLSVTLPLFQALPHPFIDGACLVAIGGGSGNILVMEVAGRAEPRPVLKTVIKDSLPIVGLGIYQPEQVLFVFGARPNANNVHVAAWQMYNQAVPSGPGLTSGLSFDPVVVDTDALDAPSVATASTNGSKALALKSAGAVNGASAAPAAPGFDWQSLWGVEVNEGVLDNIAEHSFLLDKLLAPVVHSAVLHPALGCVAIQRAPPLALREAHNIMQQRLGLISAPEAAITRRTVAVPLLRLLHASHPGKMWPGGRVAPLHTGLHFWQAAAGLGPAKLQFPCHLYYLSPGRLSKYSLASKRSGVFAELPTAAAPDAGAKSSREAKQLVHSAKQHAWLVFFEVTGGALAAADSSSRAASGSWLWTLVTDSAAAAAGEGRWYLPGSSGVFLGPQDLYFGILPEHSSTVSVYWTPGFNGKGLPVYTVSLAKPSSLGCGLFPGPAALAAPRVGAEAAAKAAREAAEAADKAAAEAAAAAEAGDEAGAAAADGGEGSTAAAAPAPAAPPPVLESTGKRYRRPGETWRPSEENDVNDEQDSMIPVLGVGAGYLQHAGQGASGAKGRGHPQHQQHDTHEEDGQVHGGGGVVLWQGAAGQLFMGGLPAPGVQYAAGEDSDDPDATEAPVGGGAAVAPDMGKVLGEHSLQLQHNERLLSVAWQNTSSSAPLEPHQCAAAILTTQRLMLVSGDLTLLAAVPASCGSVGLSNAITSFLWVGPALLYMTAAGQVMQLMWTGQSQHMASVASQPPALLAGALADSLLLVRQNPATGQDEVTSRAVGLLQPLVLGWTSLASCGLLPKGLNTARAALQALLEAFDASHVTSSMLWSLIQAWCGDVAAALAVHAADVDQSVQLAANAAAGRWGSVVTTLRSEHQNSVFYPKPAAPGSQLHYKLLAAAAGAVMHGQFQEAQQCLQTAGEWESSMALAVCSGDFAALRSLAAGLQSGMAAAAGGDAEAADIARLARGLVAAYEKSGRAFSVTTRAGQSSDWRLRAVMADNTFFSNAADWSFGGPGKLPAMETSSFNAPAALVQESEVGPVPRADTTTLGAYLGNSDLVLQEAALGAQGAAAAAGALPGSGGGSEPDFLANLDQLVALSSKSSAGANISPDGKPGIARSPSAGSSISSDTGMEGAGTAAGAAAAERQRDPFSFYDDDDDDDDGTSFGYKFRIHIKDADNPAAAGATGASAADLRSAAAKIKLGPSSSAGGFKEAFGKGAKRQDSLRSSTSGLEESPSGGPDSLYDLSFLSKPAQAQASSSGAGTSGVSLPSPSSHRPPKAPQQPAGPAATGSFDSLGSLIGISSSGSTPGLGGPAMRQKSQAAPQPAISDDDFFAALAPALPVASKGKLLSPPPPPTTAAAAEASRAGSSAAAGAGLLAPPPAVVPLRPAALPAAPAAGGGDPTALYLKGVAEMQSANWDSAAESFTQTLQALLLEASGPSRAQRQAFAAQYLAAVMLLKAAGAGTSAKEARLYRYAAALRLDDRHSLALVKESVVRNKHVGNYKYAADQLTWLVARSLGSAPMEVMTRLQEDIDECDRKGGSNASIPPEEQLDEWVSLVASATSRQEVEDVVQPVLSM